ncbi:hypothetical protein evm_007727, partial [Chilo suppressalis]
MSRHLIGDQIITATDNELLEVITEERCSPAVLSVEMEATTNTESKESKRPKQHQSSCHCNKETEHLKEKVDPEQIKTILMEKEAAIRKEFELKLALEISQLKDKFDYILQNEEVRAAHMLQEAYRERQEKITALQAQLECKNLAGLMFVMCAERRKSKLEKMRLIEEYSGYISALQNILSEGQQLILHLSRGYKTAARVDHEWRGKMKKIISEFQAYVQHFSGCPPEMNQYLFDLPALLTIKTSVHDNPKEDPIEQVEEETATYEEDHENNNAWFDLLDGECRPFVMFGDMAEFEPQQRRHVLSEVKAAKTAPKQWKEYVFNEMFVKADCSNAAYIKDEYPRRLPPHIERWECIGVQTDSPPSKVSLDHHRRVTVNNSIRGDMGSILRLITSSVPPSATRATLLAARDSIEIASATKVREKHKQSSGKVVLNIGKHKDSLFNQLEQLNDEEIYGETLLDEEPASSQQQTKVRDEEEDVPLSLTGSIHDSLEIINRGADKDSKINYEKVCPMDKCRRMRVDSFMRSLPPYMRASPFIHFEQTYDDYETCTPEQLEILMQRVDEKKKKQKAQSTFSVMEMDPLREWCGESDAVAVQTSRESLPVCTCAAPSPTPADSMQRIYDLADLIPVKQTLDEIRKDCFYDRDIEFDRFKVIGEKSSENL